MSVNYSTAVINDRLQVVIDAIDAGAGNGILNVGPTGVVPVICSLILNKPCGTISSGILTFSGLPVIAVAGFTDIAAEAEITDSAGTVIASGLTVGAGAGFDITISQTNVTGGDILSLTSATITGT